MKIFRLIALWLILLVLPCAAYNFGAPQGGYRIGVTDDPGTHVFGVINYTLRDFPITDVSANSVNGTAPEPGPGANRGVTDSNGAPGYTLSISGGKYVFAPKTSPTWGDPGLSFGTIARSTRPAFHLNQTITAGNGCDVGWDVSNSSTNSYGARFTSSKQITLTDTGTSAAVGNWSLGSNYSIVNMLRSSTTGGYFLLVKGGIYPVPTLLYVSNLGTDANLYPRWSDNGATGSFSKLSITNPGLIDSTWNTDTGIATSISASPATADTAVANKNALIEFTWTPTNSGTDTFDLQFWRTDDNNCWIVRGTQNATPSVAGTIKLFYKIGGTETEVSTGFTQIWNNAIAYRVIVTTDTPSPDTVKVIVNGVIKNLYSYGLFNNSATGVKITYAAGTSANLICWPRYPSFPAGIISNTTACDNLISYGDSINAVVGTYAGLLPLSWPNPVRNLITGVSGRSMSEMASTVETWGYTQEASGVPSFNSRTRLNWCTVWAGTNDFFTLGQTDASVTYGQLKTFCQNRRAEGYKVIVLTMMPRGNANTLDDRTRESYRITYNALIRAGWNTPGDVFADILVDAASDSLMGFQGSSASRGTTTTNQTIAIDVTAKTLTNAAGWAGFVAGDTVILSACTTAGNNTPYRIANVNGNVITYDLMGGTTTEAGNGSQGATTNTQSLGNYNTTYYSGDFVHPLAVGAARIVTLTITNLNVWLAAHGF